MSKLIDVDKIEWQKGVFVNPNTEEPLPIIHKIATIEMLRDWQEEVKAIPIPDNATNGDMIKAMFPNVEFKQGDNLISELFMKMDMADVGYASMYKKWWNAPYERSEE